MKELFGHKALNSFALWFDHYLLEKGEAYSNQTSELYYYSDDKVASPYVVFGSPWKQWVNDSAITGATIPTGMDIASSASGRNDGVIFDFQEGRILVSGGVTGESVSGSYSVKDVNVYISNDTEEDIVLESKYNANPPVWSPAIGPAPAYDTTIPAAFISMDQISNAPFAFGGMQESTVLGKAVIVSNDQYILDGVLSVFADSQDEGFPVISITGHPINEYGDLKTGYYNYDDLSNNYANSSLSLFVDSVNCSKMTDKARETLKTDYYVGFIDFQLKRHRYRHQ